LTVINDLLDFTPWPCWTAGLIELPTRSVSARVCEQVGTGAGLDEHIILSN
jgi:hypothetical protein